MDELKPCPFCGGEASENANVSFCGGNGAYIEFSAGCKKCNVFTTVTLRLVSNMPTYNFKDAIKIAIITESALYQQCKVTVDYGSAGGLEFYLHSLTDNVEKIYGGDVITLRFVVLDKNTDKIGEMVKKLSNFQSHLVKEKEVIRYI